MRFSGSQIIMPLAHTVENEEVHSQIFACTAVWFARCCHDLVSLRDITNSCRSLLYALLIYACRSLWWIVLGRIFTFFILVNFPFVSHVTFVDSIPFTACASCNFPCLIVWQIGRIPIGYWLASLITSLSFGEDNKQHVFIQDMLINCKLFFLMSVIAWNLDE